MERLFIIMRHEIKARVSYRMNAFLSIVSMVAGLLAYGLLGNSAVVSVTTGVYGMSLASYLVSGVAFSPIVNNGIGLLYQYAGPSQIEDVMVTPTGFREYVLLSSSLSLLASVGGATLSFIAGILIFQLNYSYNLPVLLAVIALGLLSSIGLGLIGLGFHLVYKQTSILSWLLFSFAGLVGNMLVPTEILPTFAQTISYLIPQYYFFTGVRVALGSEVSSGNSLLAIFALYTFVLLAGGIVVLNRGLRFIRRKGTHRWT